jgi:hypothetical protein
MLGSKLISVSRIKSASKIILASKIISVSKNKIRQVAGVGRLVLSQLADDSGPAHHTRLGSESLILEVVDTHKDSIFPIGVLGGGVCSVPFHWTRTKESSPT